MSSGLREPRKRAATFYVSDVLGAADDAAMAMADHGLTDDGVAELAHVIEEATDEGRKRNPRYQVFEHVAVAMPLDAVEAALLALAEELGADRNTPLVDKVLADFLAEDGFEAWRHLASNVPAATDRKAITAVIGTPENPVEGFDAERRLLPHAAVLVAQWHERKLTPTRTEPTAEERAELERQRDMIERRLAGTVVEEWDA